MEILSDKDPLVEEIKTNQKRGPCVSLSSSILEQQFWENWMLVNRPRLTFLFNFLIIEQQRHHFFRLERIWLEVAATDNHSLNLKTKQKHFHPYIEEKKEKKKNIGYWFQKNNVGVPFANANKTTSDKNDKRV